MLPPAPGLLSLPRVWSTPSASLARPSLPPQSGSTALSLVVLLDLSGERLPQLPVHTPLPSHLPFAPPVSASYPPRFLTVLIFFIPARTYPPGRSGGRGWLWRPPWGSGERIPMGEPGTRMALALGRRGARRGLKAQRFAGWRGRSAPRRAGLAEATLRLESGLPQGAKPTLGANKCHYSKIMKVPQSVWKTPGIGLPTRII